MLNKFIIPIILTAIVLFGLPRLCAAALLYLEPAAAQIAPGQTLEMKIKIDAQNECINAVGAKIAFPIGLLKIIDFSKGGSALTFWVESPDKAAIDLANQSGELSFSGGIPGGYCGNVVQGGGENNVLGKIIFQVPGMYVGAAATDTIAVQLLDSSQVLLNDGNGTPAKLVLNSAQFTIKNGGIVPPSLWAQELKNDTIPPEPFEIQIQRDPTLFEGKYFLTFDTNDLQTGIDYYEVNEQKAIFGKPLSAGSWNRVSSPYVLVDQTLQSKITIRAVDKAGNQRSAEYSPVVNRPEFNVLPWLELAAAALLVLVIIISIIVIIKKRK